MPICDEWWEALLREVCEKGFAQQQKTLPKPTKPVAVHVEVEVLQTDTPVAEKLRFLRHGEHVRIIWKCKCVYWKIRRDATHSRHPFVQQEVLAVYHSIFGPQPRLHRVRPPNRPP